MYMLDIKFTGALYAAEIQNMHPPRVSHTGNYEYSIQKTKNNKSRWFVIFVF